jgi:zinc/manganese transport system permease protein
VRQHRCRPSSSTTARRAPLFRRPERLRESRVVVAVASRPLLIASVDPDVARAGGVPVGLVGVGFLLVLGLAVAATSQITGALLVFALLVTPAATAHRITPRPLAGVVLSVVLALVVTWVGLGLVLLRLPGRLLDHVDRLRGLCRRAGSDLMLAQEFMRHALIAGSAVGIMCGLVGWFIVLRAQVFAGDALGHVAFTGALAAAAIGIDIRAGLFAATILGGLTMGALGDRARADDVVIGTLFAWALGIGVLCLSIFTTNGSGSNGIAGVRVLFGSILGLSASDVRTAIALAAVAVALLVVVARPLLFASLDPAVAAAQGVPVRGLGLLFLALVGLVAAEATQADRALLLLGLLAAPAGATVSLHGRRPGSRSRRRSRSLRCGSGCRSATSSRPCRRAR